MTPLRSVFQTKIKKAEGPRGTQKTSSSEPKYDCLSKSEVCWIWHKTYRWTNLSQMTLAIQGIPQRVPLGTIEEGWLLRFWMQLWMWCEWIPLETALPPIHHSQRILWQESKSLCLLFQGKGRVQAKQVTYSWQGFDRTWFYLVKWVCLLSKFSTAMVPTRHHLQGLHFCLKTTNNYSIILVTVTRMSSAAFAVVLLIPFQSSKF